MIRHFSAYLSLLLAAVALSSCNASDADEQETEPAAVASLDLTVTGQNVQAPYGNVYLFHSDEVNLDYALGYGDGRTAPLIDVSEAYHPVVRYTAGGQMKELLPISPYGTRTDGALDNHTSVRYSMAHFDIASLATTYGRVGKDSVVLVVIVLDDPQSRSWVARTVQLRRDYLIHISLPDSKEQTYIPAADLNAKWWQVTSK